MVQREVSTAALPGARLSAAETPESLGAGTARAEAERWGAIGQAGETIGRVGSVLGSIIEAERKDADEIAVLEAENKVSAWTSKRLHDPDTGALATKGKAAMGVPEAVLDEYNTYTDEIANGLTTDRQRESFAKLRIRHQADLDMTLRRHTMNEIQRFRGEELQASTQNAIQAAIQNAGDPRRVGEELARARAEIERHGPRLGLGPEQVAGQVSALQTEIHVGVIDRLLSSDQDKAAEVYFEETRDQISGKAIARVEKALEEGTLRRTAQKATDDILAAHPDDLAEQRKAAKAIDDPKVRDSVLERIEHEDAIRQRIDREQDEQRFTAAKNVIDQTGDWRKIPAADWSRFSVHQAAALKAYTEHKVTGTPIKTDPATYYLLSTMATSADPKLRDQWYKTNLLGFVDKLSPGDLQQFMDAQGRGRAGDEDKARALLSDAATQNRIADETILAMGMDPNPPQPGTEKYDPAATNRVLEFRRALREQVQKLEVETGKRATDDQVQILADRLRQPMGKELVKDRMWPFADVYRETYRFEFQSVADIPESDRRLIEDALRQRGIAVTPANIIDRYRRRTTRAAAGR